MKCPKCQFENPDTQNFCGQCGAKLEKICPDCGASNPPLYKFCGECGHGLPPAPEAIPKDLSFDEKIDKIQRYLPKGLTGKILSQKAKIEGERKQVTVMFCDMEGFTPLVRRLGPEGAYSIMDQVYEILIHKVHDYEGTVNEMTGDGIMALFGAPIALEDAPQRAIRSSLAIHREMAKFSDRMNQERKGVQPLRMRVGIHTGPVVVGTLGNDLRVEFKAVGDTVNLASRMEGLAEPGATYVSEETLELTEGLFRFEALGERQVKGRKEPVRIYRVIAPSTSRTRFDVSAERGLTPFMGRDRELGLLLDGFERSKGGGGRTFSIVSEAGLGKSRLLYEFRKTVSNADVMFLEGRCFSYSRGVAYHPLIDILKANFDIREGDGDSEIREKVKKGLKILKVDEAFTLPYFLELLSVKNSGIDKIPISPEATKDRIIEAISRIALKGSEIRPLIMAFEDLHWIDKSSEECLRYLSDSTTGSKVFLIFTYRPEYVHTWGGRSYHSQVTLNRLSNHESLAMVNHILDIEEIDSELEELILEKTEGIPFFIEEFTKSLKDLKVIERKDNKYFLVKKIQDVTIPSTIQDVIMARVDSLPEPAKELLHTGSAIQREFSYELIKCVTGLPEQKLLSQLSILKDSELLYERGIYPESTYVFKHALTQEVVYEAILSTRKKKLHEKIGNAIEWLYSKILDEHYSVLAKHFIESENYKKAAVYLKSSAEKAQKAASFKDAIEQGKQRVFCLERLPKTQDTHKEIIDARTSLSTYYMELGSLLEAREAVAPIITLALELNYKKRLPRIHTAIGLYSLWAEEDFSKGFRSLKEALKISEESDDYVSLWIARYFLGCISSLNCEFDKGLRYFAKCLDLSVLANNPVGISTTKTAITATNYLQRGQIDLAYRTSDEALSIAEERGDILTKGISYCSRGISLYFKGLFDKAESDLLKGVHLCEKADHIPWSANAYVYLGHAYCDMGHFEKAKDYYSNGISILERGGSLPSLINHLKISLERAKVFSNNEDINLTWIYELYNNIRLKFLEGWTARYIGEILLNYDNKRITEGEKWIKKAIQADKTNGMMWDLGVDYAVYADLFRRKDDRSKGKESLKKAIKILKECGADGWVEKYEKELAVLS
jgi:class 3 adenylate cyclase/tetratricopeptide (TPR) repeat protein